MTNSRHNIRDVRAPRGNTLNAQCTTGAILAFP